MPAKQQLTDALITEWTEAVKQASAWKEKEASLRRQIFDLAFPSPVIGTNKAKITHGMALIADQKINYSIDTAALASAQGDEYMRGLIDTVVRYKPEIRDGAFRKLSDEQRNMFGDIVTERPAMPSLEIKPQGKVRWK